jgi:acetylornithine deacetylase/succinyl-diaminopimelate desuccinylase-like protein
MTLPEHAAPQALVSHVEEMSRIDRRTTTEGERRSAKWVAEHLEQAGAQEVELLRFRGPSTWAWANGAHAAAGILAAAIGGSLGSALALGTLISYEADYTGRSQWLRRLLPAGTGTSVGGRLPARGPRRRTLVLVAHHDAAHSGWIWHPRALALNRWVARRTGSTPSYAGPAYAALLAVASGFGPARVAGGVFLGLGLLLAAQAAASPTAPGANDNATGVAAVLVLVGGLVADRPQGLEVIVVCPGGEEVGIAGMLAWVRERARGLDPASTLVLGLDALGAGEPVVVKRESLTATYRRAELRLADAGAARAGIPAPEHVGFAVNTDPMAARHAGLPALSILSMKDGGMGRFHQPDDTVTNVDWGSVQRCLRLARGVIETWATPSSVPPSPGGEAPGLLAAPPG